jgi:hypothetical protein
LILIAAAFSIFANAEEKPSAKKTVAISGELFETIAHGALEIGEHRFCHEENGKDDCGTFKFAMVWRKTGESWKISRVLSWGHQPPR